MIEDFIVNLMKNSKKYLYALFGMVFGILFIEYGFFKTLIPISMTVLGFKLADTYFKEKILVKIFELFERLKKNLNK